MINPAELLKEAEAELLQSGAVKRAVKFGILFSMIQATLDTYRKHANGASSVMAEQVFDTVTRNGAFDDVLHDPIEMARDDRPSSSSVKPAAGPVSPMSIEDMAAQVAEAVGLSEEEKQTLVGTIKSRMDPGVVARSDLDLAVDEARQAVADLALPQAGFVNAPEDYDLADPGSLDSATS